MMPIINVQMLEGRTVGQKRAFIVEVAAVAMRTLAAPEQAIRIILTEVSHEHWGNGSRTMAELKEQTDAPS